MTEKKKMGAGVILGVITILVTVAGMILYMMNCKTNYFANMGTDSAVIACLIIAAVLELVMIVASLKLGAKPVLDILPVVSGVLTAVAAVRFIGSRIAGIASIMTFENNAENMADLNNAIVGMVVCVVALVCVIFSSFFKVVKD